MKGVACGELERAAPLTVADAHEVAGRRTNRILGASSDVRATMTLEDAPSESEVQGPELAWSASVVTGTSVEKLVVGRLPLSGTRWFASAILSDAPMENEYRVLLTRPAAGHGPSSWRL